MPKLDVEGRRRTFSPPLIVKKIEDDWLYVNGGWIKKKNVVLLDDAPSYYKEYLRSHADSHKAYSLRGIAWHANGEYEKAVTDYAEAIRLDPDNSVIYYDRGASWFELGQYDKAIADYTEAIRLQPYNSYAYNNRGLSWSQKGEYDKAFADYTVAIQQDPKESCAYNNRGRVWSQKGDHDKAIADYTQALKLDPEYFDAYFNRGWSRGREGDHDKAIADYTEAIRLDANNPAAYNNLAWLYATCPESTFRDGDQAVVFARKACELTEFGFDLYIGTLAAAYAEAGDFKLAIEQLEAAIKLNADTNKEIREDMFAAFRNGKPYRTKN